MKKVKMRVVLPLLFLIGMFGCLSFMVKSYAAENDSIQTRENRDFPIIHGVHSDWYLKKGTAVDSAVHLKDFSNLDDLKNLEVIQDRDSKEYFCLRRYMSYPSGGPDYYLDGNPKWVDPNDSTIAPGSFPEVEKKNKASIAWLIENYYESVNGTKASKLSVFEIENMETKYAATQLAIWTFTNPRTINNTTYARTINNNEITKQIIAEAKKNAIDNVVDYEELYKKVENAEVSIGAIKQEGMSGQDYLYSAPIEGKNIDNTLALSLNQDSFGVTFGWIPANEAKEYDITNEISYTVKSNGSDANPLGTIEFKVPQKYIEDENSGTLTMHGKAQVTSRQSYILYYKNYLGFQPIGYYGKIEKNVEDYKKYDLDNLTAFKAEKEWQDNNNQDGIRPNNIYIELYQNDVPYKIDNPKVLNEENNWTTIWGGLPVKDPEGKTYKYTAKELFDGANTSDKSETLNGYESEATYPDEDDGTLVLFKNTHIPETTKIAGEKKWDDHENQDGVRPDHILVHLLADGEIFQSQEVNNLDNWSYEFIDLPVYQNGKKVTYTIIEENVPEYTTTIDGTTIINKHTPAITEIKGVKTWNDKEDQDGKRPDSITVNLLANGTQVADKKVTAADNWEYTFSDLPKYQDGKEISYTVTENEVPDYSTTISGSNLTNSYTPGQTSVTVTKAWDDGNNQDGIRPNDIQVQLYGDGQAVGESVTLNAANQWTHTWEGLDQKKSGKDITYTVKELAVPKGYENSINDDNQGNIIISNHYTPAVTEIKGNKVWDDKSNQDGKRPSEITVNLLADGEPVTAKKVTAAENWEYTFSDLPKYKDGKEIIYTVTENHIKDYSTEIKGNDIINHYTPGQTSVTVTKKWEDAENQDGIRPKEIHVQLYGDEQAIGEPITLNSTNQWTHTWSELDLMKEGQPIVYTIKEVDSPKDYESSINGQDQGNILLTNHHTPELTEIKGSKKWDDQEDQDGKRPNAITVNLLADGQPIANKKVTAAENWTYTFSDLPKYKEGKEISYTITEDKVADYSTEIQGNNIINHYTPGKTSMTVTKAWDDNNNQANVRPNSIQVQLYGDEQAIGEPVLLSADNNWSTTWNDLHLKKDKKEIVYTVKEVAVPKNYTATIDDKNLGNIVITNTYNAEKKTVPTSSSPTNNSTNSMLERLLPTTGEQQSKGWIVLGMIILVIIGLLYWFRKTKNTR
ncbi:Cna B-type domain-containing protein (plasmid) [Enterococcus sp. 22-H-5-01]|uniref:Cna B-type domain-containing protein n=1 Tax=Enterococcus sp. 22-H-5-01 TaxID=3418555 RepID=UPI003D03BACB